MNKIIVGSEGKGFYGSRLINYLLKLAYPNYEIEWKNTEDCDIIIKSHFIHGEKLWCKTKKPYIYWSGEPFLIAKHDNHTQFLDIATIFTKNNLYVPYLALTFDKEHKKINANRPYLVAYCSRRYVNEREQLFTLICDKASENQCFALSRCCGNSPKAVKKPIGGNWSSPHLINEYSNYKFVFALENSIIPGYITEKIWNVFKSGAIPIYWGDESIKILFNPKAFIFVRDFKTLNDCAEYIVNMSDKKILEMQNEPIFPNGKLPDILSIDNFKKPSKYYLDMADKVKNLINKKGKIHFISYGDDNYKESKIRIENEAKNFGAFDNISVYGSEHIDNKFKEKFKDILSQRRGGGYWIWKPYFVNKKLKEMNEGDYLVYLDAGCQINKEGIDRFREYIELLDNSEKPFIGFQLVHQEKLWTKKEVFDYFKSSDEIINSSQLVGGIIILKKTYLTEYICLKWLETLYKASYLFTDEIREKQIEGFRQPRHDQSIISCLRKRYGCIIIPDETYFMNREIAKKYPFWASRIRC